MTPAPEGPYGVWCEPVGHLGNPQWMDSTPVSFENAQRDADRMCRVNPAWHYTSRPLLGKHPAIQGVK